MSDDPQAKRAELNRRVTAAIGVAERVSSSAKAAAWSKVSRLEERIASLVSGDELEGEVARLGAVSSALEAGEAGRAAELARRYLDEASMTPYGLELMSTRLRRAALLEGRHHRRDS